jgi:hypothetical protein
MYCPKCSTAAVPGQRYCRKCGANLGAILDVMEGKRGQIDFETLKSDLLQLGMNLRVGFEQAKESFKNQTNQLQTPVPPATRGQTPAPTLAPPPLGNTAAPPEVIREMRRTIKELRRLFNKVKPANARKYSLQQAALKIFSGGAGLVAWKYVLTQAASSGLLLSIERTIQSRGDVPLEGLVPVLASLWLLSLIPIAQGVAHLVNGIFFAPKPEALEPAEPEPAWQAYSAQNFGYQPQAQAMPPVAPTPSVIPTNELEHDTGPLKQPVSVTEDETRRFEESVLKQT